MATYRQGDVFLFRVRPSKNQVLKPAKDNCVAKGEATGHAHFILDGDVLVDQEGNLIVKAGKKTSIHHLDAATGVQAEHRPLTLDPGMYKVVIQREYEPEGWRQVRD